MFTSNQNQLLEVALGAQTSYKIGKDLEQRITGRFYTHERIGRYMAKEIANNLTKTKDLKIVDPFCGDARLLCWLLEELLESNKLPKEKLVVEAWDCDGDAIVNAKELIKNATKDLKIPSIEIKSQQTDSFELALKNVEKFDVCITNPPWEAIKPDSRELANLDEKSRSKYVNLLKEKVCWLEENYPHSKPTRKFSGWGTNLARCGIEASVKIVKSNGIFSIVAPGTIFGDQISAPIRSWLFTQNTVNTIHHYPASARLFDGVDQAAISFTGFKTIDEKHLQGHLQVIQHFEEITDELPPVLDFPIKTLMESDYSIGFGSDPKISKAMTYLSTLPKLGDFENGKIALYKLGRELDETGIAQRLSKEGEVKFVKGRQITRYGLIDDEPVYLKQYISVPDSVKLPRLIWRDVARQTSARRVIATTIPPGIVTGNSLNVLTPKQDDPTLLYAMLGVFNSIVFEAQVRASISTNHLSVGAMRRIRVPDLSENEAVKKISKLVAKQLLRPSNKTAAQIEVEVARWYGLPDEVYSSLLYRLEEHSAEEVFEIKKILQSKPMQILGNNVIPNHYAASLSELDLQICKAVPPGGNWKDIPEDVPSERIKNIRLSFAKGEGSRSTYYGRLHPDRPSYTINTYFTRPGNGCHIHYDFDGGQHRTLSQREAARLQSFPDNFVFKGNKGSIATQIGNAVPPLLAFQVARHLNIVGQTVDLFAGAGGLGLGFGWAGWKTLVGSELESSFSETYSANVHPDIVVGDITATQTKQKILEKVVAARDPKKPLCVLGGPPCQGFSTAGNKRSMEDDRNWLFKDYCTLLAEIKPDVFVFENVTGLLNMEGGRVFEMVKAELSKHAKRLIVWKLHSENYGVPQRRSRVIIVGDNTGKVPAAPPKIVSSMAADDLISNIPNPPSVGEALDDLPALDPGQDGSNLDYKHLAQTPYQQLMRGQITAELYIQKITQ
jgi:DNA-cytosine methyltransferase